MDLYLISHISSDEWGMPYWLQHHVPLFDHGILVDYNTDDATLDIIKQLAPDWEVIKTKNDIFWGEGPTKELVDIENGLIGWKMILNVTEFVLHPNLKEYVKNLENIGKRAINTNGVIMVDNDNTNNQPLVLQKTYGYIEKDIVLGKHRHKTHLSRSREIHNYKNGKYCLYGRHYNYNTDEIDESLFLCWFGWSPFDNIKTRRKHMGNVVNSISWLPDAEGYDNIKRDYIDILNDDIFNERYIYEKSLSYNLLDNTSYKKAYDKFVFEHRCLIL